MYVREAKKRERSHPSQEESMAANNRGAGLLAWMKAVMNRNLCVQEQRLLSLLLPPPHDFFCDADDRRVEDRLAWATSNYRLGS